MSFASRSSLAACLVTFLGACSDENTTPDASSVPLDLGLDAPMDGGFVPPRDANVDLGALSNLLEVESFGVQGFLVSYGGEAVMTAPMFTRQSAFQIALNTPLSADEPAIASEFAGTTLANVRAIVSGHAHFDHLIDVPHTLALAPDATLYANRSAAHILAALAPDRAASCTSPAPSAVLARTRVVALDDPTNSRVDYTNCPAQQPAGAPLEGSWLTVPGSHIRLMAVCTTHPPQVGAIHFGEGSVDVDLCDLPVAASGWLEGQTLSYVIDFLDELGAPVFRIYYQDAPATRPIGELPPAILAERRVDLAILCVGTNDAVTNQPTDIIANLNPRYVFSGHWEDFFIPRDRPPHNIFLLNVSGYVARAEAALSVPADLPLLIDGATVDTRHVLVTPGSRLFVPPPP
jgi:hypothetical protein